MSVTHGRAALQHLAGASRTTFSAPLATALAAGASAASRAAARYPSPRSAVAAAAAAALHARQASSDSGAGAGGPHKRVMAAAGAGGTLPRKHRPFEALPRLTGDRPPHHAADGTFANPWPSYVDQTPMDFFTKALPQLRRLEAYELPRVPVEWAALRSPGSALQATWVGHASFLVQAGGWNVLTDPVFRKRASPSQWFGPARFTPPACAVAELPPVHVVLLSHNHYDHLDVGSVRDLLAKEKRDLAAAAASAGASPSSAAPSPHATRPYSGTLWVCPLRVADNLAAAGVPRGSIVELDWWDAATPAVTAAGGVDPSGAAAHVVRSFSPSSGSVSSAGGASGSSGTATPASAAARSRAPSAAAAEAVAAEHAAASAAPTIVCVPAQHQSARTAWDRNHTLWAGYVLIAPTTTPGGSGSASAAADAASAAAAAHAHPSDVRLFFSGDTGYRSVPQANPPIAPLSPEEDALPACPAFAEVGERLGPMDLALLPLGAYSPRVFMSSFHASPEDSVAMHADVRSRRSVGMHWGAFPLTDEPVEEPPERLRAAAAAKGLAPGEFVAVWPGGTVTAEGGPLAPAHEVTAPTPAYAAAAERAARKGREGWFRWLSFFK